MLGEIGREQVNLTGVQPLDCEGGVQVQTLASQGREVGQQRLANQLVRKSHLAAGVRGQYVGSLRLFNGFQQPVFVETLA